MSPLAAAVYDILRLRPGLPDSRITYAQLAGRLRDTSDDFEHVTHRSQHLYAALCEVGEECRRLRLPSLAALVVRADSRRPGAAYFEGRDPPLRYRGEQIAAWQQEVEAVRQAVYPPRHSSPRSLKEDRSTERCTAASGPSDRAATSAGPPSAPPPHR